MKVEFAYDYTGRCFERKEYSLAGGSWNLDRTVYIVYDEYKQIAEYVNGVLHQQYAWDIAGLDTVAFMSKNNSTYMYWTDGNKNVLKVFDASGEQAGYAYDPFGRVTSASGALANDNPFRFSSEYHNDTTGLVEYIYRKYDPVFGRWISRDPIEEQGGVNVYVMVDNSVIHYDDYLGYVKGGGNYIIVDLAAVRRNALRWNRSGRFASKSDYIRQATSSNKFVGTDYHLTSISSLALSIPGILYSYYLDKAEHDLKSVVKNIGALRLIQQHASMPYCNKGSYIYEGKIVCGGIIEDDMISKGGFELPSVKYPLKNLGVPVDIALALLNVPQTSVSLGGTISKMPIATLHYRPKVEMAWRCLSSSRLRWQINIVGYPQKSLIKMEVKESGYFNQIVSGICCQCKGR